MKTPPTQEELIALEELTADWIDFGLPKEEEAPAQAIAVALQTSLPELLWILHEGACALHRRHYRPPPAEEVRARAVARLAKMHPA